MGETDIQIISISDLLCLSSPLSGTAFLHTSISPSPSPPPLKKPKALTNPNPNPRNFSPFNQPVLIIGTIHLPSPQDSCKDHCFAFSDGPSRVCCSLLDLKDLSFLGNEIHVLAWNFLPFKHKKGGILEIIRWVLPTSLLVSRNLQPSFSVPLRSHHLNVVGALKSVSKVFAIGSKDPGSSGNSIGFLAEIICCPCDRCSNYDFKSPVLELSRHSFMDSNFIYFMKPASKWRPLLNKLVGKLVAVSGLKKKLIVVGEGTSYEMFVTMETTAVSLHQLPLGVVPSWKDGGVYNGVVSGVYMQGMVVELDEKVWLLATDRGIAPPHSVRVGAIISVRNFHLICPKFSWTKMHLLGTCARTSIDVKFCSLVDSRSYVRTASRSMLERFIQSLTLSAKFWVLLLVSCFRRKFAKIFSDEEILGSNNQEGLAQVYASGHLDSHFFQSQHGIFKEFCNGQCTCENDPSTPSLKLVTPISNLISKCEALWMSAISGTQCDAKTIKRDGCGKHFTTKVTSCCCTIRRIISSEDIGCIMVGTLKVSTSGRLLLVDATGAIDIVVPDLVSYLSCLNIFEVKNYKLIMEGSPEQLGCMGFHRMEAFSCRNIFEQFPLKKALNQLTVYILFYLRDSTCLNVPFRLPSSGFENDIFSVTSEITYLLLVTHKFPATKNVGSIDEQIQDAPHISCSSTLYAEAIVLPYKLILPEVNEGYALENVLPGELHEESNELEQDLSYKSRDTGDGLRLYFEEAKRRLSKLPCLFTFRSTDRQGPPVRGYLCKTENTSLGNLTGKDRECRVLLEFKLHSLFKYQFLQLGGYYILKTTGRGQCNTTYSNKMNNHKIPVTPQMMLWRVSFSFGEIAHQTDPSEDNLSGVSSVRASDAFVGDVSQNHDLQQPLSQMHRISDIHIHIFSEMENIIRTFSKLGEVLTVSSCIRMMKTEVGTTSSAADPQGRDMPQGNLVSLFGNINNIQIFNFKPRLYMSSKHFDCTDVDPRMSCNIVIHVHDDHHNVQIHGSMSKNVFPVGMGPGANATFYRVLVTCPPNGCPTLVLTPASFVVINSIKESGHRRSDKRNTPKVKFNVLDDECPGGVSHLISQLTQCMESKLIRINCRVANVYILVLELPTHVPSKKQMKLPSFNITLAGFMLDDGSSLSCCWANGGTAERLLRLHESTHKPHFHSCGSSMKAGIRSSLDTVGYHLEKMLKKHHRVVVKNNRAAPDSFTLGFTFVAESEEVFSCSDERLLRVIMLNACVGSIFNIAGTVMDPNDLQLLGAELKDLHVPMQPMPNIWIAEVRCLDPRNEARSILNQLRS